MFWILTGVGDEIFESFCKLIAAHLVPALEGAVVLDCVTHGTRKLVVILNSISREASLGIAGMYMSVAQ